MWQGRAVWLSLAAVGRAVKVWEEGLHYLGVGVATKYQKQNKTKPGNSNNQEMTEQWKQTWAGQEDGEGLEITGSGASVDARGEGKEAQQSKSWLHTDPSHQVSALLLLLLTHLLSCSHPFTLHEGMTSP